ncbi:hypothetical protein EX30DRAFT_396750 [Ascodesmis nigricans]|uniref:Uncharacterized protein n=1 Tax=Ascodesmis nigricans TaxID=341454 RepID=A0A4S2MTT7_9PEZI|nr:hypothetical protein EX30DRAFT_396750 [Ascodesmis nigricans]
MTTPPPSTPTPPVLAILLASTLPPTSLSHLHLTCLPRPGAFHPSICIISPSHRPSSFITLAITLILLLLALIITLIVGLLSWLSLRVKRDLRGAEVVEGIGVREEWEKEKRRKREEMDRRLEEMRRRRDEREGEEESDSDEESEMGDALGVDINIYIKLWEEVGDDEASNRHYCGCHGSSTASDDDTSSDESSPSPSALPHSTPSLFLDSNPNPTSPPPQPSSPRIKLTDHPSLPLRCPHHPARQPYLSTTNPSLPPGVFTHLGFTAPQLTTYLREITAEQNPYKLRALISDLSIFVHWVEFAVKPSLLEAEKLEARAVRNRSLKAPDVSVQEEGEEMRYIKMRGREREVCRAVLGGITEDWDVGRLRRVSKELREKVRWEEEVIGPVLREAREVKEVKGRIVGRGEGFECCREWMPSESESESESGDDEDEDGEVVEMITDCPLWMFPRFSDYEDEDGQDYEEDYDDDYADYDEEGEVESVLIPTHCCHDSHVLTGSSTTCSSLCHQYEIITSAPSDEDYGLIEPITENCGFTRCHSTPVAEEKPDDNSEAEAKIVENTETENNKPTDPKDLDQVECTATNTPADEPTPVISTTESDLTVPVVTVTDSEPNAVLFSSAGSSL